MDWQSLAYAIVQVAHNFGAAALVGSAFSALWLADGQPEIRHKLAWVMLFAWAVQAASGAGFGVVSFLYYGELPDIHGIAIAALVIKIGCAAAGFLLAAVYLHAAARWAEPMRTRVWRGQAVLSATALTAAAFLRWFS